MDTVKVKTLDLIKKVEANKSTHTDTYDKAVVAYRKELTRLLEVLLDDSKAGRKVNRNALSQLPVPEEHTQDYRAAIEMLKMETRKELKLSQRDFRRYVMDEWEWQQSFASNTSNYVPGR